MTGNWKRAVFCGLLIVGLLLSRQDCYGTCREFSGVIENGGYGIADFSGNIIDGCNLDEIYIPASTVKIITALTAYDILGPSYRFSTEFYLDQERALYIKGYGDPLLISEAVKEISGTLKQRGVNRVSGIFVDNSVYGIASMPPGSRLSSNAYDAPVASTSVNFNTLPIEIDTRGRAFSSERQTPFVPLMREMSAKRGKGKYRINICSGGCRFPQNKAARYTGELFAAFLRQAGVQVGNELGMRAVPAEAARVYTHVSEKSLDEILRKMLHYSSNFIANQLFLTCGAVEYGYPATWEKGAAAVRKVLSERLGEETADQVVMVDGAGLSRENRMSAGAMLKVLEAFSQHASLLDKRRGVFAKTGTLKGVYNYAGYLNEETAYVILLNQRENRREQVLDRLKKHYGAVGRTATIRR